MHCPLQVLLTDEEVFRTYSGSEDFEEEGEEHETFREKESAASGSAGKHHDPRAARCDSRSEAVKGQVRLAESHRDRHLARPCSGSLRRRI